MIGAHDPFLASFSVLAAVLAAYATLDLANRVGATPGRLRAAWIVGGACALGVGIWSMHFIGMLALELPTEVVYDVRLVLGSMAIAVGAAAVALVLVAAPEVTPARLTSSGVVMGLAIASMHYLDMEAMQMAARPRYDPWLVLLSLVIAVAASLLALRLALRFRPGRSAGPGPGGFGAKALASLVLGGAIAGTHYTAMAAVTFVPAPAPTITGGVLAGGGLTAAVMVATLLVLGLAVSGAMVDRWRLALHAEAEALRLSEARFRLLAETLPSIVWTATPEGRTDYYNSRWHDYTGTEADDAAAGSWPDVIHPDDRARSLEAWRLAIATGRPYDVSYRLRDADGVFRWHLGRALPERDERGRILRWYGSATDVHQQKLAELELEREVAERTRELQQALERLRGEMAERLALEADLRKLRGRLAERREEERHALAREIHDDAIQQLMALSYRVAAVVAAARPGSSDPPAPTPDAAPSGGGAPPAEHAAAGWVPAAQLVPLRQEVLTVAHSLRRLIRGLRPTGLDEFGLRVALEGFLGGLAGHEPHCAEIGAAAPASGNAPEHAPENIVDDDAVRASVRTPAGERVEVELRVHGDRRLSPALELCLFRTTQEAIRNALKHAHAERIEVELTLDETEARLRVQDDGRGFQVPPSLGQLVRDDHFGLLGALEHVTALDGTLDVDSAPGHGCVVSVRLPVASAALPARPQDATTASDPSPDPGAS